MSYAFLLAAQDLFARAKDPKRQTDYERIAREEKGYALSAIRRADWRRRG